MIIDEISLRWKYKDDSGQEIKPEAVLGFR